jgi:hypothetical protein
MDANGPDKTGQAADESSMWIAMPRSAKVWKTIAD